MFIVLEDLLKGEIILCLSFKSKANLLFLKFNSINKNIEFYSFHHFEELENKSHKMAHRNIGKKFKYYNRY